MARPWVAGHDVTAMTRDEQLKLWRERVALVFQSFALLPMLSPAGNIGVPMRLSRIEPAARKRRVSAPLSLVGLEKAGTSGRVSCPAANNGGSASRGRNGQI